MAIEGEKLTKNNQTQVNPSSRKPRRRAIAPVIATLLLVAIAVVGGSMVFVFAQDYFSQTQISGVIEPEHVEIFGFDARDTSPLRAHNGLDLLPANCCGTEDGIKIPDERIAIHIQNNSAKPITISELRLGGVEYQYTTTNQLGNWIADPIGPQQGEYVIMIGNDGTVNGDVLQEQSPTITAGGIVTLVLDLDRTIPLARDVQVKITTDNGNIFVSTIITGKNVN